MCANPIFISKVGQRVPCGQCIQCRVKRTSEWTLRLEHEVFMAGGLACFVTLTYDDDHVMYNISDGSPVMTLEKSHFQKYMKRLRKKYTDRKITYFAVGEYGEKKGRPHYHIILIGLDWTDQKIHDDIINSWNDEKGLIGSVDISMFNSTTCRYVTDYIQKTYIADKKLEREYYKGAQKPFQLQSKGIGLDYIRLDSEHMKTTGKVIYHGKEIPLPRYYYNKIQPNEKVKLNNKASLVKKLCKAYDKNILKNMFGQSDFSGLYLDQKFFLELNQKEINMRSKRNLKRRGVL